MNEFRQQFIPRQHLGAINILTLLKISAYLLATLLTVSIAAKAISTLQPPNPTLRGFIEGCQDKPQPCWNGIVPNSTTQQEASPILEKMGYEFAEIIPGRDGHKVMQFRHSSRMNCSLELFTTGDTVNTLMLISCLDIRFGDWLLQYPNAALYTSAFSNFETAGGKIQFVVLSKGLLGNIDFLIINPARSVETLSFFQWRGMMPFWKYCQLQPKAESCAI